MIIQFQVDEGIDDAAVDALQYVRVRVCLDGQAADPGEHVSGPFRCADRGGVALERGGASDQSLAPREKPDDLGVQFVDRGTDLDKCQRGISHTDDLRTPDGGTGRCGCR
jgi:hypothetical protein